VALPAAFGISQQITQLSNAMSLDEAASLGVRSTVFITGPRGTGKFSAAVRIARHLQMHYVEVSSRLSTWDLVEMIVLQVNCFNVLSDTSAKTEVSLREEVENAIACSPCLVVLRHADALSHAVTPVDGKEGSSSYLLYLPSVYSLFAF
jgi:peroxin-6